MSNVFSKLSAALADRYVLERELGRGGMATVYLARDLRHDRPVALKVLHPELAAILGPERFLREIKFAARLQHPHILSVHDSGETAGCLWFTMPYVAGESLRERLRREKQLPVEEALRITTEAARALDYAHREGVVHRDVKPENILLTKDGDTLVADFGIARALSTTDDRLTETGLAVGTLAYMSPEQGAGERELDGRTDIYSLGVVLYELLAGEPPYTGPTSQAVLALRFMGEAPRVRRLRPAVPEAVEQAILKALAPVPADRFPTAAEFARALAAPAAVPRVTTPASTLATAVQVPAPAPPRPTTRRRVRVPVAATALGLGFLIGLGVLFGWLRRHTEEGAGGRGPKRVAVLPFENLGRPEDEYFADGVTDAIRGKLTTLPGLQVIASNSSGQYKRTPKSPQQIGRELGVEYLLLGKVRWEKDQSGPSRVQVSPELIQVSTASAKWQEPFDAALTDVFQVQADVSARVAQALGVALGAGEREELAERPTRDLAAYDAYLQGNRAAPSIAAATVEDLRRAIRHYERAVALDSSFALAWAQLSRARARLYFNSAPTAADDERARRAAEQALALAPGLTEAHLALGDYYTQVRKDPTRALEQYAIGRRTAPNDVELLVATALNEEQRGRWEEGYTFLRKARALDPRSVSTARRLAYTLLWLRRYPEALRASDEGLALAPANIDMRETKAMVYLAQGDLPGARTVLRAAPKEVEPTALVAFVALYWDLVWVLDEEQQRLLLRLTPSDFDDNLASWGLVLAQTYALRGDLPRARVYADSARLGFLEQLKAAPEDEQQHVLYGLTLAYLGRKAEAIQEGERGVALMPVMKNAFGGPYVQHQLVRIYLLVGEPDKALDRLEPLLKIPYYLSPGWLKIDPTFAPLRGNPRFERLLAAK